MAILIQKIKIVEILLFIYKKYMSILIYEQFKLICN